MNIIMKKRFPHLIVILVGIGIICTRCQQNDNQSMLRVIDLENISETTKKASEIFETLDVIRLELRNESVLGEIRNVEFFENSIFVTDNKKLVLFEFDLNGNFIKSLNKFGKGPSEYLELCDFIIDEQRRIIEILDCKQNKIIKYNIDSFSYVETIDLEVKNSKSFVKENGIYVIQTNGFTNNINNEPTNSPLIFFNSKNNEFRPVFNIVKEPSNYFSSIEYNKVFSSGYDGYVYASFMFNDTIFRIKNFVAEPFLRIQAGNRGYPDDFLNSSTDEKREVLRNQIHIFDDKIGLFFFYPLGNEDFLIFFQEGLADPRLTSRFFFHLNGGQNTFAANLLLNDFFPFNGIRMKYFRKSLPDKTLLYVLYPYDIEDQDLLDGLEITRSDNPLLLLFRLPKNES